MTTASMSWCDRARAKLAVMDALIAQGQGDTRVEGGGCTEPGGGIMPTTPTAHEMAAMLRMQIATSCAPSVGTGYPPVPSDCACRKVLGTDAPGVGFGQAEVLVAPATVTSPWAVALVTSVVGAATGWVIEEVATHVRRRRRRRS
jgi:hypothetical protein